MRWLLTLLLYQALVTVHVQASALAATQAEPASHGRSDDPGADSRAQVPGLYQAWKAERDSTKRSDLARQLLDAVIRCYVNQPIDIADEVARDGLPYHLITVPTTERTVAVASIYTLKDTFRQEGRYPIGPVFRRISATHFEAWTSKEGWLFNAEGKLLVHVNVPRRDGAGREWFGAFLPDGTWITTDIWANDQQLNCYSSFGQWKWELRGATILAGLPKPGSNEASYDIPLIGWARSDKTGKRWLVSVGANMSGATVFVDWDGHAHRLPDNASPWQQVYPHAMGVRGGYVAFSIDSDDAEKSLGFETVAHGPFSVWPEYNLSSAWGKTIYEGTTRFGFWPRSHDVYIEVPERVLEPWHSVPHTWFFDTAGRYQGEISGSYLDVAANERDILFDAGENKVVRITAGKKGPTISGVRAFAWSDGSPAIPLAVYDDIKLGFFLRGPGITGNSDDARRARVAAEIVLAKW